MTSQDSLIESARPISEAEARIEAALKVAQRSIDACEKIDPAKGGHAIAFAAVLALGQIIALLDGGQS